jgi:hypothetical protein
MGAENHHYVPKFILRNFLTDVQKEHVSVYDKHTDKVFVTAIKNIMSERRFNELEYEDFVASFEPVASKIEDSILPRYRSIVQHRRLDGSVEEKADLSFLIAFQILRVKAIRDQFTDLEEQLGEIVKDAGYTMNQVKGWEPLTEDTLKLMHLGNIQEEIGELAQIISQKIMFLAQPPKNRTFYIGDNPVTLNNSVDTRPYGNLGLSVKGIEIYLPLSAELTLGAFCPSVFMDISERLAATRKLTQASTQNLAVHGIITFNEMTRRMRRFEEETEAGTSMLKCAAAGVPFILNDTNMDFYNSLQMQWAKRYVIGMRGDFDFARKFNRKFPELRTR